MRRLVLFLCVSLMMAFPFGPFVNAMMAADGESALAGPVMGPAFPQTLPLPVGFRPEGIALGRGTTFFVGGLGNFNADGVVVGAALFRGDLRTGEGEVIAELPDGQMAVGIKYDRRTNYLFVAGGIATNVVVYDVGKGEVAATYPLTDGTFANDLFVARDAVYVTDSFSSLLFRLPLGQGGALPAEGPISGFPMIGDYEQGDGSYPFQANGIVATANGKWLIVLNSNTGRLYRVDPNTGDATEIDLGGETIPFGDGLVLSGKTLYVVQNYANQVTAVKLNASLTAGSIVETITDPGFAVPTTAIKFRSALYVVNARFVESEPLNAESPDIPYEVLKVSVK
jgi:hypothetical protein